MSMIPAPPKALLQVLVCYLVAGAAFYVVARQTAELGLFASVALGDLAATVVVFAWSLATNNSSFYDPYWSVAPPAILAYLATLPLPGVTPTRVALLALAVSPWAIRLTLNWLRNWEGMAHEDWRYVHFRKQWGKAYWLGSFGAIHLFPTVMTFAGSLPFFAALLSDRPVSLLEWVGAAIAWLGTIIEGVADEQLRAFRASGAGGGVIDSGLWRTSRHPNYFGEILFWIGLAVMGLGAAPSALYGALGAIAIAAMFVFGTIPLAEARALERRPAFRDHQRKVSLLIPWFRR